MSELVVGDILRGYYINLHEARYYRVVRVTPKQVKVQRLKHTRENLPSENAYGPILNYTKKGEYQASCYKEIATRIDLVKDLKEDFLYLTTGKRSE
jgi:hypothetical protein